MLQIDCDKTIMVMLKHDDKLQDGSECSFQVALISLIYHPSPHYLVNFIFLNHCLIILIFFHIQCAVLYTTVYGQRRIRVTTLSLPCTSMLSNLFRAADLDTQFSCYMKQGKQIGYFSLVLSLQDLLCMFSHFALVIVFSSKPRA